MCLFANDNETDDTIFLQMIKSELYKIPFTCNFFYSFGFMETERRKNNPILKYSFEFAVDIVKFSDKLIADRKEVMGKQLVKSGTSIGANVNEAQNAESKKDFIHKFKISAKEVDETEYWLMLCKEVYGYKEPDLLLSKLQVIAKLINKIIVTSKESLTH